MRTVTFLRRTHQWRVFRDTSERTDSEGRVLLTVEELQDIPSVDLKNALMSTIDYDVYVEPEAIVCDMPPEYLDSDSYIDTGIRFEIQDEKLIVGVQYYSDHSFDGDETVLSSKIRAVLTPFLCRNGGSIASVEVELFPMDYIGISLRFHVPWRGKSLRDLYLVAERVTKL